MHTLRISLKFLLSMAIDGNTVNWGVASNITGRRFESSHLNNIPLLCLDSAALLILLILATDLLVWSNPNKSNRHSPVQ